MNRERRDMVREPRAKYGNDILDVVHEGASGLYRLGLIDKETMRRFDENCLTQVSDIRPEDVKALREREHASQAVLAKYLFVSTNTVGQWERGERKPTGAAAKLLALAAAKGLDYIK